MKQKLTCIAVILHAFLFNFKPLKHFSRFLMLLCLWCSLFLPTKIFSQTPNGTANLGILTSFGAYTGAGGVSNGAGASFTGDVGTNIGIISGFGAPPAFIGNTYNANATTTQARFDLFRFYIHLFDKFVDYPATHAPAFGGGETLTPGVYSIPGAGSIGGNLTLDGGGNSNAFFIIRWGGALTAGAGTTITLTGGTQSCNVFFMSAGAISIAASANLKGTLFARVGAVGIGASAVIEGRMLSMEGAIVTGVGAVVTLPPGTCTIPIFCESGCSVAPSVDVLGVLSNYALFTSLGAVSNTSTSGINGKIGANVGASSGYEASIVIGTFETANAATAQAKIDIDTAYNRLMALPNTVPSDLGVLPVVLLAHAAAFGSVAPSGETINAGVYFIGGAGSLSGTLTLDAQNNPNAIFVFKFAGAFSVAAQTKIILVNGARRCNVFWIGGAGVATGAVSIAAASELKGTFLSHGGACTSGAGLFLSGRLLSTGGAVTTYAGIVYNNPECVTSTSLGVPVILAVADTTTAVNGLTGGVTTSLTLNDRLGGVPVVIGTAPGNVTLSGVTVTTGLTLNANGTVTIAPNTPAGNYSLTYKICEVTNPSNCSTVASTVTVTANPIVNPITGSDSVCVGSTTQLSSSPSGGVWSSNNTSVATVNSSTGVVTGVSSGTATISYTVTNSNGSITVTVTNCTSPFGVTSTTINAFTPANAQLTGNASSQIAPTGGTQPYSYTGTNAAGAPSTNSKRGGSFIVDSTTGVYTYTPPVNYVGKDTFYITVCDEYAIPTPTCATVTYTVQVGTPLSVNTAPAYVNTNANTPVSNNASSTMSVSGGLQPYTYSVANAAGNTTTISVKGGSVTINSTTGVYTYTPATNFSGTDTFYITVCDATTPIPNCATQLYIVTVNGTSAVTGGGGGGVESKTLGDVIAVRLYGNAVNSKTETTAYTNKFVTSGVIVNGTQDLSLNALIPATVSNTDAAYTSTPTDLVNFTNAVEVLAVDYTKAGSTKAVAFGTKTLGDVYTHTKPICDRLKGAELQEVKNITVNGFNLMAYKVRQRTGETEYAINLSAGTAINRNTISLQSNWFTDSYQQDEKLYNFQLWAVSYEMVQSMAAEIIGKLQAIGTVNAVTSKDLPKAYISKGSRKGTDLTVTVNNNTAATSGYFELHEKANENAATTTRQIAFTVAANAATDVAIPVRDNYEGDIYVYLKNKLTDLVYLADGTWNLDYNKATTSISKFDVVNESNPTTNSNEHRLFRNVAVTGTSKDYITIYKTMMGGGLEQNVADYKSIMFNANAIGAGKVQVTLVKKSITNWNEQYTYTMDLDGAKEYGINLNQFKSTKFNDAITANDITAVNFSFFTSRSVPTAMNINLSKARFSNAVVATTTNDASTMKVTPNPTTGRFTTTFVSTASESVTVNVTEIASGKTVFTKSIAANKGSNELVIDLNKQSQIAGGMYLVSIKSDTQVFKPAKVVISK